MPNYNIIISVQTTMFYSCKIEAKNKKEAELNVLSQKGNYKTELWVSDNHPNPIVTTQIVMGEEVNER